MAKGESCVRYSGEEYSDSGRQRISVRAAACDNSMVDGMQRQKSMAACSCVLVGDFSKAAPSIGLREASESRNFGQSRAVSISFNLQFVLSCFIHDPTFAMAYNNYPRMFSCPNVSRSGHLLTLYTAPGSSYGRPPYGYPPNMAPPPAMGTLLSCINHI